MMEIVISQNENQNIRVENNSIQNIGITQDDNQNINIQNKPPQELDIEQGRNQTILIDGGGIAYGITDVLVNGVSVVSDNIAYILVPTKTSELTNDSGFITNETDPTVPSYIKAISLADINNWNNKQNELISGTTIKTINNTSILGSGNIEVGSTDYVAGYGIDINGNEISNTIVSYNDLEDLPTIPTKTSDLINDSDYVTENELSDVAFSGSYADLSNIPVIPDSTSDLTNDSGFINKNVNDLTYYTPTADLGAVALSNDYTDLINKPTIPTVNDGILTIQKNSTNIDTFSANSASNKTINITVPTTTSELTNNSGFIDNTVNNLTNYTPSSSLSTVATTGSYNDLTNKPTIPTKTSELTNDSGFITNNYEIYSTNETRIGTWINGKPLYRRVYNFTLTTSTYTFTNYSINLSNIDIIYINGNSFIKSTGGNFYQVNIGRYQNNEFAYNGEYSWFRINGGNVSYAIGNNLAGGNCYLIVEYTKTTD